jgi:hypothetical protein
MRTRLLLGLTLMVAGIFTATTLQAHIKNEASQFPDIEFSDARFDIVMLVGAGIIPQTPVFEPDKPLSMAELATWAALARGIGPGGETPNTTQLAQAVLDAGLLTSLAGDARYADINTLLFDDQLTIENPDAVPSKAEAARFIAGFIGTDVGDTLLTARNLTLGETGEVTAVGTPEGGRGYVITIGDVMLQMDGHGRVANGPTDLFQWEGRYVTRSFVHGDGENARWTYIEAGQPPAPEQTAAETDPVDGPEGAPMPTASDTPTAVASAEETSNSSLLTFLVIAVVLLGALLFFQGRRKG